MQPTKHWSEDDDRDDVQFWAEQKEEYLKENPSHASFFSAEEEDKDEGDDSDDDVVDVTDKNWLCVKNIFVQSF